MLGLPWWANICWTETQLVPGRKDLHMDWNWSNADQQTFTAAGYSYWYCVKAYKQFSVELLLSQHWPVTIWFWADTGLFLTTNLGVGLILGQQILVLNTTGMMLRSKCLVLLQYKDNSKHLVSTRYQTDAGYQTINFRPISGQSDHQTWSPSYIRTMLAASRIGVVRTRPVLASKYLVLVRSQANVGQQEVVAFV